MNRNEDAYTDEYGYTYQPEDTRMTAEDVEAWNHRLIEDFKRDWVEENIGSNDSLSRLREMWLADAMGQWHHTNDSGEWVKEQNGESMEWHEDKDGYQSKAMADIDKKMNAVYEAAKHGAQAVIDLIGEADAEEACGADNDENMKTFYIGADDLIDPEDYDLNENGNKTYRYTITTDGDLVRLDGEDED